MRIDKSKFRSESPLQQTSNSVLEIRKNLLIDYNLSWKKMIGWVRLEDVREEGTFSQTHVRFSYMALPSFVSVIIEKAFESIDANHVEPDVTVSRRKAMMFAETGKVDHNATQTIFGQIVS